MRTGTAMVLCLSLMAGIVPAQEYEVAVDDEEVLDVEMISDTVLPADESVDTDTELILEIPEEDLSEEPDAIVPDMVNAGTESADTESVDTESVDTEVLDAAEYIDSSEDPSEDVQEDEEYLLAAADTKHVLNTSQIYVEIGGEYQVKATAGTVVSWSVSNESYATVDNNGLVRGVVSTSSLTSSNLPVLKATFDDGAVAECKITVCPEWKINKDSVELKQGGTLNFDDTSSYSYTDVLWSGGLSYDDYSYSIDNPDLFRDVTFYSSIGCLRMDGYALGTARVSVTAKKLQKTLSFDVTVIEDFSIKEYRSSSSYSYSSSYVPITEATLNTGKVKELDLHTDFCDTCIWSVSDPSVLELTSGSSIYKRSVKALTGGTATVTVTNELGQTASVDITVYDLADDVTFNRTSYTLYLGMSDQLDYTVTPESDYYETSIEFESGSYKNGVDSYGWTVYKSYDKDSARIEEDGTITTLKAGKSRWKVTVGGCSNTIEITVLQPSLKQKIQLYRNKTIQLNYADINDIAQWTSSDPSVASVENGLVKALKAGKSTITASYNGFKATTTVTVLNPKLSASRMTMYMKAAKSLKVTGGVGKVAWSSSNRGIATVSSTGVVKGIKPGTATITAKVSGISLTCKVTVNKPTISRTTATAYMNVPFTLKVNGGDGAIKWKSSKKKVASVNSNGVITPKKKGTAVITATRNGYKMTCKVKVVANKYSEWVDKNARNYTYGEPVEMLSKVYFKGKNLIAEIYIMNARMFRADRFDWWTIWLYDDDDNLIAKKKLKKYKLGIKPYGTKKVKIKFKGSEIKNKKVILNKGVYLEDDWYYHYSY